MYFLLAGWKLEVAAYVWCRGCDNVLIKNAVLKASVERVLGGNFIFDKTLLALIIQSTFYDLSLQIIETDVMRHEIAEQAVCHTIKSSHHGVVGDKFTSHSFKSTQGWGRDDGRGLGVLDGYWGGGFFWQRWLFINWRIWCVDGVLGLFTDWKYHLDHLTSCEVNKSWNRRIWQLEVSNQDDK